MISRRALIVGLAAAPIVLSARSIASAETLPKMTVTKDPSCGCCGAWVDHVCKAGFPVEVIESPGVNRLKIRLGVPQALASCHTAEVSGYVIEGHIPADAIKRLLAEKPKARGIAVRECRSAPPDRRSRALRTTPTTSSCSEPRIKRPLPAIAESSDPKV